MSVKDKKLSLMWHCKTPRGWLRFPAIFDGEGHRKEARVGWVYERGELKHYPDGRFQVRSWDQGKQKYETLTVKHGRDAVLRWEYLTRAAKLAAGQLKRATTFKGSAAAYVTDLEKEQKHEAAEHARLVLAEFDVVCAPITAKHVTRDHIFRFHAALRKRGIGERTIANKHNRIKSFLRFCKLDTSFMPDTPKFDKKAAPTVYTPAQVDAIRTAANDYMRLAIDMALMLGLRERELMYSCWTDVNFHERTFRVTSKPDLKFLIKDREERILPMPAELIERLQERQRQVPGSRLILGTKNNTPNGHLLRMLKSLAQKAGLNCGQCKTCRKHVPDAPDSWRTLVIRPRDPKSGQECQQFTLHKLRRSYLTTLLRSGVDARTVKEFAGHSELSTTLKYLAPASAEEMQTKINAIQWNGNSNGDTVKTKLKRTTKM